MPKIRIFTDGACSGNPGPGGWAALILFDEDSQAISGNEHMTTNNRMELKAVVESTKFALSLGHESIEIYSDSAYVVNAVNNGWLKKWHKTGWQTTDNKPVKNKDLWMQLIIQLRKSSQIKFFKVKGHSGDKHNDQVDRLARQQIEKLKELAF